MVGEIAVLLLFFWICFGVVLYVVCHISFHTPIDVCISHFETIAFMCRDMVRVSVWSLVIGVAS